MSRVVLSVAVVGGGKKKDPGSSEETGHRASSVKGVGADTTR